MLAELYLEPGFPALELHQTLEEALAEMDAHATRELVLVDEENRPIAIVDRATALQLMQHGDDFETIGIQNFAKASVLSSQHVFDVVRLMAEANLHVVASTDNDGYFVGSITRERVFQAFRDWLTFTQPGCVLVIDTDWVGYSIAEIGGIIESNGARLLGSVVSAVPGTGRIFVTLKVNEGNVPSVVRAFERYGYTIAFTFLTPEQHSNVQENYDALMRFLDI